MINMSPAEGAKKPVFPAFFIYQISSSLSESAKGSNSRESCKFMFNFLFT